MLARPSPVEDLTSGPHDSLRLRDSEGELLREVVNGQGSRARWAPLEQLSPLVVDATIAVEVERLVSEHVRALALGGATNAAALVLARCCRR